MSFQQRLQEIREGFAPPFWVANGTELFERMAYYGQSAVLAIFLHESLHLSVEQTGQLLGYFGFAVWIVPIVAGSLADRFGFRKSLAFAYFVLTIGYFLMGSLSASWMAPLRNTLPLYWLVFAVLMVPALGPGIVKPCVVGTTARASSETVRSVGYSIYYTIVNIGGTLGPLTANLIRDRLGLGSEAVFRFSALLVFFMFLAILIFFKEPAQAGEKQVSSIFAAIKNVGVVLGNYRLVVPVIFAAVVLKIFAAIYSFSPPWWVWLGLLALALAGLNRFMWFLVIFSGFYFVFWQQYIALPLYLRGYVDPKAKVDLLLSIDPFAIITLQIVISYVTRKIPTFRAMTLGVLIASTSWLFLLAGKSVWLVVASLVVLALGEMTLSARFYEYISRLAPSGQQGTYMGFAFFPVAIGYFAAGPFGGSLVQYYGEVAHQPARIWLVVSSMGFATTLLMWIYDRVVKPSSTP